MIVLLRIWNLFFLCILKQCHAIPIWQIKYLSFCYVLGPCLFSWIWNHLPQVGVFFLGKIQKYHCFANRLMRWLVCASESQVWDQWPWLLPLRQQNFPQNSLSLSLSTQVQKWILALTHEQPLPMFFDFK